MAAPESTCWTAIQAAADGSPADRDAFARRYGPVVRAYLAARWRFSHRLHELDDAVQGVFVECFKQGGVLARAERGQPGGFRAFLYGVVRHVALRIEARRTRGRERQPVARELRQIPSDDSNLSRAFDRAWAKALLREAGRRMEQDAQQRGEAAVRRVELLRLRFHEDLPIRDVARRWGTEPAALHREYARAREEFRAALLEVVAFHHPGSAAHLQQECAELLALLG
jgi:RNA polymerase sigma-70 factor (ECF subfamily)